MDFRKFRPELKAIGDILYIGVPSVIMIAIGSVMSFGVNLILSGFSSAAVAVFGVYFRLQNFAFMPIFGLNNALVPTQLLLLFNASEDMLSIGIPALRIISLSFVFAGICVISGSFFQALGNSIYSMIVSVMRQLVVLLPLVWIFAQTSVLSSVWLSWPIAELVSLACSLYFLYRIHKKVIRPLRTAG